MILDGVCTSELSSVLAVVRWIVNLVKLAVPILLVVLATFDLAKVVTNSKGDDSETKKAVKTLITRIIYGLIIYFVPIIIVWLLTCSHKDNTFFPYTVIVYVKFSSKVAG